MAKDSFTSARFITTALAASHYPKLYAANGVTPLPEIAVAGRSNVGKSSLLNHLFRAPGLVKTSATPGKTQALNFFACSDSVVFVDLPGYGYAQVPLALRKQWGPMVQTYLNKRASLQAILLLFDIRRTPQEDDQVMIRWAETVGKPLILVLTKVDKVNQSERAKNKKAIIEALHAEAFPVVLYSVLKNMGRKELCIALERVIKDDKI